MKAWHLLLIAAAGVGLAACKSNSSPSCSTAGGTTLASSPWPKFRADPANSGRSAVDLNASTGIGRVLFDQKHCSITTMQSCVDDTGCPIPQTCVTIGPVSTTPILGPQRIFLASSDGTVYVIDAQGQPVTLTDPIQVPSAILGSPLLGSDGTLFVPSDGQMSQFFNDGTLKDVAALVGFIAASPNIWVDGTIYVGSQSGGFTAVCANGIARFTVTLPPTQSAAAVVQDPNMPTTVTPIIVVGGLNGQVRAYTLIGRQYWSFFASTNIVAAVMVDTTTSLFYVADTGGHVFAGDLHNGQPTGGFSFTAREGITASLALGRDAENGGPGTTMYAADQSGVLYALDRATGAVRWTFQADGPISSSPAVATGGLKDVIIFAADIITVLPSVGPVATGGLVYAVQDDGDSGTLLWTFDPASADPAGLSYSIGASSPSIGADGTVYIGRTGSRLGVGDECATQPCVVNKGGALYAINIMPTPTATTEMPSPTPTTVP